MSEKQSAINKFRQDFYDYFNRKLTYITFEVNDEEIDKNKTPKLANSLDNFTSELCLSNESNELMKEPTNCLSQQIDQNILNDECQQIYSNVPVVNVIQRDSEKVLVEIPVELYRYIFEGSNIPSLVSTSITDQVQVLPQDENSSGNYYNFFNVPTSNTLTINQSNIIESNVEDNILHLYSMVDSAMTKDILLQAVEDINVEDTNLQISLDENTNSNIDENLKLHREEVITLTTSLGCVELKECSVILHDFMKQNASYSRIKNLSKKSDLKRKLKCTEKKENGKVNSKKLKIKPMDCNSDNDFKKTYTSKWVDDLSTTQCNNEVNINQLIQDTNFIFVADIENDALQLAEYIEEDSLMCRTSIKDVTTDIPLTSDNNTFNVFSPYLPTSKETPSSIDSGYPMEQDKYHSSDAIDKNQTFNKEICCPSNNDSIEKERQHVENEKREKNETNFRKTDENIISNTSRQMEDNSLQFTDSSLNQSAAVKSSMEKCNKKSTNLKKPEVLSIFNKPCLRKLDGKFCSTTCQYSHNLPSSDDIFKKLSLQSNDNINFIYSSFISRFKYAFMNYFEMICQLFGTRKMKLSLLSTIGDCEHFSLRKFYKYIFDGLVLGNVTSHDAILYIYDKCSKSNDCYDNLLHIVVEVDALEFSDKIKMFHPKGKANSSTIIKLLYQLLDKPQETRLQLIFINLLEQYASSRLCEQSVLDIISHNVRHVLCNIGDTYLLQKLFTIISR